jgi:hypothetical protein
MRASGEFNALTDLLLTDLLLTDLLYSVILRVPRGESRLLSGSPLLFCHCGFIDGRPDVIAHQKRSLGTTSSYP